MLSAHAHKLPGIEIVRCTHTLQFSDQPCLRQCMQRRCQLCTGYVLCRALVIKVFSPNTIQVAIEISDLTLRGRAKEEQVSKTSQFK